MKDDALNVVKAEHGMKLAAEDIRQAYHQAPPVLAVALMPLIADAERLRQKLAELAEACRAEGL